MFRKLLIANRGEIACRVIAHRAAPGHRDGRRLFRCRSRTRCTWRLADEAYPHRPGAGARKLSARSTTILEAARPSRRARRSIPGYGFLSENADFAEACAAAGLVFVGPPAARDPRHGLEGGGEGADGRGRRAAGARLSRRRPGRRDAWRARPQRIGYPGADQGLGRRRRQGHAHRRAADGLRRGARRRAARGAAAVRRRPRADREISAPARATSRSRSSPTRTATASSCSSATARCSAATRK